LATTYLSGVRPQPVRWEVKEYIPHGKLVMFAGDGGHGKSRVTLDITACLTTGRPYLSLDYTPDGPADVLLVDCEDDVADTIVPRPMSAGADLSRVFQVEGIKTKDAKAAPFSLAHYERVAEELQERPNVRFVVIDPAGAFIDRGVDDHKDSEPRALLGPLSTLAAMCRVSILLVKHLGKGVTPKAVHKVNGSVGYFNSVRTAFLTVPDADDDGLKYFLPLKFNLGPKPEGLSYRLEPIPEDERLAILYCMTHLGEEDRERLGQQLFLVKWLDR
jgi:RecA-family ATPase